MAPIPRGSLSPTPSINCPLPSKSALVVNRNQSNNRATNCNKYSSLDYVSALAVFSDATLSQMCTLLLPSTHKITNTNPPSSHDLPPKKVSVQTISESHNKLKSKTKNDIGKKEKLLDIYRKCQTACDVIKQFHAQPENCSAPLVHSSLSKGSCRSSGLNMNMKRKPGAHSTHLHYGKHHQLSLSRRGNININKHISRKSSNNNIANGSAAVSNNNGLTGIVLNQRAHRINPGLPQRDSSNQLTENSYITSIPSAQSNQKIIPPSRFPISHSKPNLSANMNKGGNQNLTLISSKSNTVGGSNLSSSSVPPKSALSFLAALNSRPASSQPQAQSHNINNTSISSNVSSPPYQQANNPNTVTAQSALRIFPLNYDTTITANDIAKGKNHLSPNLMKQSCTKILPNGREVVSQLKPEKVLPKCNNSLSRTYHPLKKSTTSEESSSGESTIIQITSAGDNVIGSSSSLSSPIKFPVKKKRPLPLSPDTSRQCSIRSVRSLHSSVSKRNHNPSIIEEKTKMCHVGDSILVKFGDGKIHEAIVRNVNNFDQVTWNYDVEFDNGEIHENVQKECMFEKK